MENGNIPPPISSILTERWEVFYTENTDYVLVKETALETAVSALKNAGYAVD